MGRTTRRRAGSTARAAAACAAIACAACSTRDPYADKLWYYAPEPGSVIIPREQHGPRSLAMFHGPDGAPVDWNGLWNGVRWADIVVIGEQHDDANAHALQQAVWEETVAAWPGSAVSLEMLERDEQPAVDAYLAGEIDEATFVERTGSRDWASEGTWGDFYQPVIDEARLAKAPVIAANAPREYVRRARTEGYGALAALPPEERALFSLPAADPPPTYRARFRDFMSGGGEREVDEARVDEVLRSQRLWDATMADSIVRALDGLPAHAKVVHLVGQFHSEYDGGLVSEIQARAPGAKVLTVSVQRGEARALREEDRGKADVVVYGVAPRLKWTGFQAGLKPPEDERPAEEEAPAWGFAY
jgi:uncharacterized iron-regulated protein